MDTKRDLEVIIPGRNELPGASSIFATTDNTIFKSRRVTAGYKKANALR